MKESIKLNLFERGGTVDMCLAIQQMREESRAAGFAEGFAKGFAEGFAKGFAGERLKVCAEMVMEGKISAQTAAGKCGLTAEEFSAQTGVPVPQN